MLAKLPQIGDKGTLLDYEGAYEDADKRAKRIAAGESVGVGSTPVDANGMPSNGYYYDSTGQAVVMTGSAASVGQQDPESVQKAWAEYYAAGGTPEAASAYYSQSADPSLAAYYDAYQNQGHGTGATQVEQEESSEQYVQDNSAYAVEYSNEQYAYPHPSAVAQEEQEERPPGTEAPPGLGLVAYADSDEDDD